MKFLKLPSSRPYIERSQKRKKKFLESSSLHLIYRRKEKLSREHIQKEEKNFLPRKNQERKFFQSIIYSKQKGEIRTGDFLEKLSSGIYRKKKEIRKVSFLLYIEEEQKDFLSSFADSLSSIVNRKSFSEALVELVRLAYLRRDEKDELSMDSV